MHVIVQQLSDAYHERGVEAAGVGVQQAALQVHLAEGQVLNELGQVAQVVGLQGKGQAPQAGTLRCHNEGRVVPSFHISSVGACSQTALRRPAN